ncbi:protein LTV1 homolog [Argonauta hians]
MPRHKTKFIDKKNAVTFHLVHRSQQDPMLVSEDASHFVLLPSAPNKQKQLEEQRKFGIYFDDDYNYLQHLKDTDETVEMEETERFQLQSSQPCKVAPDVKLHLPSTVFSSGVETKVGLLNKAAPHSGPKLDWDPDIVAGLDDDYDFEDPEGVLDDDFMTLANDKESGDEEEDSDDDDDDDDDDDSDVSSNLGDRSGSDDDDDCFMEEETKSRFTNYSMTSSVVPRSEALKDIDDQFEKFFEQYDDTEIGALDMDDIEGTLDVKGETIASMLQKYQHSKEPQNLDEALRNTSVDVNNLNISSTDSEGEIEVEDNAEKWDCESILSTYSNLYNHPQLILEPKKTPKIKLNKMGIPQDAFYTRGIKLKDLEDDTASSVMSVSTVRNKDETKEERKERKSIIKAQRKERRVEKKLNQQAFKDAKLKRDMEIISMQKNMKSVTIA